MISSGKPTQNGATWSLNVINIFGNNKHRSMNERWSVSRFLKQDSKVKSGMFAHWSEKRHKEAFTRTATYYLPLFNSCRNQRYANQTHSAESLQLAGSLVKPKQLNPGCSYRAPNFASQVHFPWERYQTPCNSAKCWRVAHACSLEIYPWTCMK